jgi:RNA-directed DNA polymerase
MQRAATVTSGDLRDWPASAWKRVYRSVKNLRQRILRASSAGDLKNGRALQRLMRRCRATMWDSGRRVTQVNHGRDTPGVDQVLVTTLEERGRLCQQLSRLALHQVHPVRRVYLPKREGQRPLGIPTIVARWVQAMGKNALEPVWEARFEGRRDGARPGRGCHDAIERLLRLARPNTTRPWGGAADLDGALNKLGPAALVQTMGNFPARALIKQGLKAGDVEDERLHPTDTGGPQGGVSSPVLLNVALHGMAHALGIAYTPKGVRRGPDAVVRYAEDLAV